ncbi:hypothetical protein D9M72_626670 [compost metagenome]
MGFHRFDLDRHIAPPGDRRAGHQGPADPTKGDEISADLIRIDHSVENLGDGPIDTSIHPKFERHDLFSHCAGAAYVIKT